MSDVIVVGGGFGGLYAAKEAAKHGLAVTLIDANGYQTFQPLLYQAATGLLPQSVIRYELTDVHGVNAITGRVNEIDLHTLTITLVDGRSMSADSLVLATGATVTYFDVTGANEFAYPLYTADDAQRIKGRIHELVKSERAFSVVVVGAGATGIEITGAIGDLIDSVLPNTFPKFDGESVSIHVVDHAAIPLAHMNHESGAYAQRVLAARKVTFHLGSTVSTVSADSLTLVNGTSLRSDLTIWAAGVAVNTPKLMPSQSLGSDGRLIIDAELRLPGYEHVYVIGDASADEKAPLPQLGAVAKQQGMHVGESLGRQHRGKAPRPFTYKDMGEMAMIRHDHAIVEMGSKRREIEGDPAFDMWLGIHAALLPDGDHRRKAIEAWIHEMRTGTSRFLLD